ncbi:hypothetical protein, partial [Enterococcus faecalis]
KTNQTKIELDESNSISLELPKQLKKSKYFYLDKKSNFWGAHHLIKVDGYFLLSLHSIIGLKRIELNVVLW